MPDLEPQGPHEDVTDRLAGVVPCGVLMGKPVIAEMCAKADFPKPENEPKAEREKPANNWKPILGQGR